MRKKIIAIAASVILLPSIALADTHDRHESKQQIEFNGPVDLTPLATLSEMTFGEQDAIIEGNIVRQISHETFSFTDGTENIVIELDDDIQPGKSINDQTRLRLFGEYDAWDKEFEVDRLQVL